MSRLRPYLTLLLVLCSGMVMGCFSAQPERSTARYPSPSPFQGPSGDNAVQILVALVERPVGDYVLNDEIWELADEQGLDLGTKRQLHDNGLRMGQFGSLPPASLRDLIRSERSCANPRRIRMYSGNSTTVTLGSAQPQCLFNLVRNSELTPVELDQAVCQFQITPTLLPGNETRLRITPLIKHGQTSMTHRSIKDPSGTMRWETVLEQPVETYSHLSWEQTVSDSEYIVIGTWVERSGTLGQRCFIQTDLDPPIQRLLVLRALRGGIDPVPSGDLLSHSPSLAAQAGLSTARGMRP